MVREGKGGTHRVAVSTSCLITALLIHARGAIVGTAKATSKVAKALANIAKKGAPILIPIQLQLHCHGVPKVLPGWRHTYGF